MIILIAHIVCFFECIANASWDAISIKINHKVNHELNAGVYLAFVIIFSFIGTWELALPLLAMRPLVFDNALSEMRGLPHLYHPVKPQALLDKIETFIFKKDVALKSNVCYFILLIAGEIILFT